MRLTVLDTNGSMKRADPPGPGQAQGQSQEPEKLIYHYLYSAWPDFGVPEGDNRHALVALVQASRGHSTNNTQDGADDSPRIVHCSAGVGRSGTFIALDHLLSELEDGALDRVEPRDRDVIAEAVDTMRMQRTMMVQGPAQFQFLYDVLREQWLARHGQSDD